MNDIKNCTIRTELPPMTQEEAQRKFERFEKLEKKLGTKEVKEDSLIKNFAEGMISGAIAVPVFICARQSTDWKVDVLTCMFFTAIFAIVARCLGFKNLLSASQTGNH